MAHAQRSASGATPVRIALAGCGRIAQLVHLDALAAAPGLDLVAVADTDAESRRRAAERAPAVTVAERMEDLVADDRVEAVLVALPTHLHADAARVALAAGKHVYVEKPLAVSVDDARSVVDAWHGSGLTARVGFNFRFQPHYRRIREEVHAGRVGRVVAVRTAMGSARRELPGWKRSRSTGGGVLLDLCSHQVDLARFVLGREVVRVLGASSSDEEQQTVALTLGLDDGTPVQLLASHAGADLDILEVMGEGGVIAADRLADGEVAFTEARRRYTRADRLRRVARGARRATRAARRELLDPGEPSFAAALAEFAAAVRGSPAGGADLIAGLRALEVLRAAEQAISAGAAVAVDARA